MHKTFNGCFHFSPCSILLKIMFIIFFLSETTHLHLQLMKLQQEVQSLRQQMDKFLPLVDTIANYALESQGKYFLPSSSVSL